MKKPKKRRKARGAKLPTVEQLKWQTRIRKLIAAAAPKDPKLDDEDRITVLTLCGVLDGYDLRKQFGIKPKRGSPKKNLSRRNLDVAACYWFLIDGPTKLKQADASSRTAKIFQGVGASQAYKIALQFPWMRKYGLRLMHADERASLLLRIEKTA